MITLDGTIQRKFFFPSDPETSLIYFGNLSRVIYFLPHISVVETYDNDSLRIRFQTVELGAYTINVFCDLECKTQADAMTIKVGPIQGRQPVEAESTLNATTGYGFFTSDALLFEERDGTGIDYRFRFQAKLPRPRGLRMMPKRVVDKIAHSISQGRLEEMMDGFMEGANEAFPEWLENHRSLVSASRR